jgi:hypothetical protein
LCTTGSALPGDFLDNAEDAMRPLVVHASSTSLVDAPRRVLHIEYAARMVMAESLELAMA